MKKLFILAMFLTILTGLNSVRAVTVVANQDCYVDSWGPNTNFNNINLLAGNYEVGRAFKTLLRFNLPTLAPDEGFASAYLGLTQGGGGGDPNLLTFPILQVTGAWSESTCTYNTQPATGNLIAVLQSGSAYDGEFVVTDVHKAVVDAGSGGTLDIMIDYRILELGRYASKLWYSKEHDYKPQLMMLIGPPQRLASVAPSQDCYVDNWGPNTVNNGVVLIAGNYEEGRWFGTLLQFPVPTIAGDEAFAAAQLSLYQAGVGGVDPCTVTFLIQKVNGSWNETTCTYNNRPPTGALVGMLMTSPGYNNTRVSADVLDAVKDAGGGGTLNIIISHSIEQGGMFSGTWYSEEYAADPYYGSIPNASDYFRPRLDLTIVKQGAECAPGLDGDVNADCVVDFKDVAALAGNWLQCTWNEPNLCP